MKDYAKVYKLHEFGLEVLNETQFVEEEHGFMTDTRVLIHIINIRLNPQALNAYIGAICKNERECYETREEYEQHKKEMDARMELWQKTLIEHLDITVREKDSFCVTQNVAEFFTVVYMENLKEYGEKKIKYLKPTIQAVYEADLIYDQIESMLGRIAEENADTVCSVCMSTKDDLLSLAKELIGADARDKLEEYYDQTVAEWIGEESE